MLDTELQNVADFVGSTSQIFKRLKVFKVKEFLIGTEIGLIYRMKKF